MISKVLKIIGVNILVFLVLILLIEAVYQVNALIRPSYDVLYLQPDRVLGWKHVPNFHWTWAGQDWYASEFSVNVETNPLGFRDIAREFPKPHGVKRVALLGDSFIQALQVPFEKTAGQLLEQSLNTSSDKNLEHSWKWEVLNFGVASYGVGQYLLTWEQYARNYEPDYVAIFVAKFHMERTVSKYSFGSFDSSKERLWVRPTFRVENNELIREPAEDFDKFLKAQEDLINTEFDGQRSRRKRRLITLDYARQFKNGLVQFIRHPEQNHKLIRTPSIIDTDSEAELLAINLKIIEELNRKVISEGGRLVVLDVSRSFGDNETVYSALKELCSKNAIGYIPLYDDLLKADMDGIPTRWPHDDHFNETGNEIMAKALFRWISQHSPMNESR